MSSSEDERASDKPDDEPEEEEYQVEKIVKKRTRNGVVEVSFRFCKAAHGVVQECNCDHCFIILQYFLKWKNYDDSDNTWE